MIRANVSTSWEKREDESAFWLFCQLHRNFSLWPISFWVSSCVLTALDSSFESALVDVYQIFLNHASIVYLFYQSNGNQWKEIVLLSMMKYILLFYSLTKCNFCRTQPATQSFCLELNDWPFFNFNFFMHFLVNDWSGSWTFIGFFVGGTDVEGFSVLFSLDLVLVVTIGSTVVVAVVVSGVVAVVVVSGVVALGVVSGVVAFVVVVSGVVPVWLCKYISNNVKFEFLKSKFKIETFYPSNYGNANANASSHSIRD